MRWTAEDFAQAASAFRREMAGAIRRMMIGAAPGSIWQLVGHYLFDTTKQETRDAPYFHNIGTFARPPANNGSAEAIMMQVGGANGPAIVATRDEATRAKVDDIAADESTLYNSQSRVYVKADSTIEARSHGGTAKELAFNDALKLLIDTIKGAASGNAIPGAVAAAFPADPTGTAKFKAE